MPRLPGGAQRNPQVVPSAGYLPLVVTEQADGSGDFPERLVEVTPFPMYVAQEAEGLGLAHGFVEFGEHLPRGGLGAECGSDLPGLEPEGAQAEQRPGLGGQVIVARRVQGTPVQVASLVPMPPLH